MQRRQFWLNTCNQSFTSPVELKGLNMIRTWLSDPFQKQKIGCIRRYCVKVPLLPLPQMVEFQSPPKETFSIPVHPHSLGKTWIVHRSWRQIWALPLVFLPVDLAVKLFLFSKACAIVWASTCIRTLGPLLCNTTCQPAVVIDRLLISTSRVIRSTWLFCGSCMLSGGW